MPKQPDLKKGTLWKSNFSCLEIFDVLFVFVLMFALFKDFSDIFINLIPLIGPILSLTFSALCAIFIFLIMFLLGAGANRKIARRLVVIFIGTLVDTVPFVNFLPIETIVVIIAFLMVLMERKEKNQEKKQQEKTQQAYA